MFFQGIRGAITVDSNTSQDILNKTRILLTELIERNDLSYQQIVSIIFTATRDLDAQYPAVAARELGMTHIPLMCCQEMYVEGSLPRCIRVLIQIQTQERKDTKPVYMGEAACLRPDLFSKDN